MWPKYIFDNRPIPQKIQRISMGIEKHTCRTSRTKKKISGFSMGGQEKVMWIFLES